jgi:hypothetical protein
VDSYASQAIQTYIHIFRFNFHELTYLLENDLMYLIKQRQIPLCLKLNLKKVCENKFHADFYKCSFAYFIELQCEKAKLFFNNLTTTKTKPIILQTAYRYSVCPMALEMCKILKNM